MDYEEKYKQALERAKKLYEQGTITESLGYVFPELKDEDEEVRLEIRNFIWEYPDKLPERDKWLAWFEKQGEIDLEHYKDGENEKRKFVGYGFLKCKGDFLSFKEGETYWLEYVGKDNYNVRSDNLLGQTFHIKPVELYTVFRPTTWLEKQDEKKPIFNADDWYVSEVDGKIHNTKFIEKQGGEKPTDEVEPKFKVGDWIVNNVCFPMQIASIKDGMYIFTKGDAISVLFIDENYHLWTIEDAKDGDVLTNGESIVIFKQIVEPKYRQYIEAYIGLDLSCNIQVTPATKEQRDFLFQKMKEAGYEWDSKKKELKKIEPKKGGEQ